MSSKWKMIREEKLINVCNLNEKKRIELKLIIKDKTKSGVERMNAMMKLDAMNRMGSRVKQRKRCALTYRARGTYSIGIKKQQSKKRDIVISRHVLREYADAGLLPGFHKASW